MVAQQDLIDIPPKPKRRPKREPKARKKVVPAYLQQVATVGQAPAPGWTEILEEARLHLARALFQARAENDAEALSRVVGAACRAASSLVALEKLAAAELVELSDEELKQMLKGALK
jgi:hypothetical protein